MNQAQEDMAIVRNRFLYPKILNWLKKARQWIYPYRPRFRDWHFWIVQGIIIGIAAVHDIIEVGGYIPSLGVLYFLPISLFFVPVVYAALYFGFHGSIATAIWVIIITIPNWIFWHQGLERLGVIFQMSLLVAVAVFVGQRVDRENAARQKTEDANVAIRTYATHIVQAQEEERQRIARELHDQTIQGLALLNQRLGTIKDRNPHLPSAVAEEVREAQQLAEESAKEVRNFIWSLRPPILDDLGIVPSIRRLVLDSTERTGMKGHFRLVGKERRLPQDIEVGMFRIAQEALWNVERHSKGTEMAITITLTKDEARIDISDNGIGFTVPQVLHSFYTTGKLGVLGMQERAELIGGKLEIQSIPKKGVTVNFSIPIVERNAG